MRNLSRLLVLGSLFVFLGFFPIQQAKAAYPTDFLRIREATNKRSEVQREEQRAKKRVYENRPTEINARLRQVKPKVEQSKVSQRVRRKETQVWKSHSESEKLRKERLSQRASVRTSVALEKLRAEIILSVNTQRQEADVPPLRLNLTLQGSAQAYAEDMKNRNFFSHESPEGEKPQDRIQRGGYGNITEQNCHCRSFTAAFGENLARGQQTVDDVMNDWMNSPPHRANILSELYKEIGVGIEGFYWVQHFGSVQSVPRE